VLYKGALEYFIGIIKRKGIYIRKERTFRVRDNIGLLAEKFLLHTLKSRMV